MQYQFSDSDVKAIVILENFAHNLEQIPGHTKISIVITTSLGELLGPVKGLIVNLVVRHVKKNGAQVQHSQYRLFKEVKGARL